MQKINVKEGQDIGAYTIRALLEEGARRLKADGVASAIREAEWLLAGLLRVKPLELYIEQDSLSEETVEHFFAWVAARGRGFPLQYLIGEEAFRGEWFYVTPGVFIPRPETEMVLEAALCAFRALSLQRRRPLSILDLGTGCGCIAVSLARALGACEIVGVDVSWEALQVARRNVWRHDLSLRIQLVQGKWAHAVSGPVDGIISNPPYVPESLVDRLPLDVRKEPRLSIEGGKDGTRELRVIFDQARSLLSPGGILVLECGEDQVQVLRKLAEISSWVDRVDEIRDLALRPRGCVIRRNYGRRR